jgi:RNA polymerase sigma-70 factor (ECF subfamily)
MDELELIHSAQSGDLEAFNVLVLAHQDLAYNVAYRILLDPAACEDVTQNAFLSAYRNLNMYRGGSFKAWLMRIVTNLCYDELRRRKRRPTVPLEPISEDGEEELESPGWMQDGEAGPEERAEQADLNRAIEHCLGGLPDEFRAVAVMIDIQGMDYQEVSEVVGKPLGTIKSRLARARVRLRDCLQGFWELLPVELRLESEERV